VECQIHIKDTINMSSVKSQVRNIRGIVCGHAILQVMKEEKTNTGRDYLIFSGSDR
jgi:hypothetical protein